jgi:hypothetical protein
MEVRMKFGFIQRFCVAFIDAAFQRGLRSDYSERSLDRSVAIEEDDRRSARDYEVYYWTAVFGPWN